MKNVSLFLLIMLVAITIVPFVSASPFFVGATPANNTIYYAPPNATGIINVSVAGFNWTKAYFNYSNTITLFNMSVMTATNTTLVHLNGSGVQNKDQFIFTQNNASTANLTVMRIAGGGTFEVRFNGVLVGNTTGTGNTTFSGVQQNYINGWNNVSYRRLSGAVDIDSSTLTFTKRDYEFGFVFNEGAIRLYNYTFVVEGFNGVAPYRNTTGRRFFSLQTNGTPFWSNNISFPASPTYYSPSKTSQFNITWNDSENNVDKSVITHDFFGSPQSFIMTNVSNVYTYSTVGIPVGTYSWSVRDNDTFSNINTTQSFSYVVIPDTPTSSFETAFPSSPATYALGIIHTFNTTFSTVQNSINNAWITTNVNGVLTNYSMSSVPITNTSVRYSYAFNDVAVGNYTWQAFANASNIIGSTLLFDYQILPATPAITLKINGINGDTSSEPLVPINISGTKQSGIGLLELFRDFNISMGSGNNISTTYVPSGNRTYYFTLSLNESQNYTSVSVTHSVTVPPFHDVGIFGTLSCPNDTIPNTLIFIAVGGFLVVILFINLVTIRIPILNMIIAMGIIAYSFTLMGCSWFMGVIMIFIGIFIFITSLFIGKP